VNLLALLLVLADLPPTAAGQQAIASHATSGSPRPPAVEVVRVNGVALTSDRLDVVLNALIPQESFHRTVSEPQMADLRRKALQILVDEELQYQSGVRRGVSVTAADVDAGLARATVKYPNRTAFIDALRRSGATLADVRREIRRTLTIEKSRAQAVAAKCRATRADAARFFAANPERFVLPEQLHVYAITIGVDPGASREEWEAAKARAEDVLRQVQAGAAFEEMARKYSTDPTKTKGGDMGLVHRGSFSEEFEQATRAMRPGDVNGVIQTIYGFHIVRLAEILLPRKKTFAEVSSDIRRDLTSTRCAEMRNAWTAQLRAAATIAMR
jgi:parvulin-like peptidyl-prolyl isomerase